MEPVAQLPDLPLQQGTIRANRLRIRSNLRVCWRCLHRSLQRNRF